MRSGAIRFAFGFVAALVFGVVLRASMAGGGSAAEKPQQIVATTATIAAAVNNPFGNCVAIQAAPGTGNMLAANYTVPHGVRQLLLSADFQNATVVYARINGTNMALLSGASFGADQLAGPIAVPVEEGDTVNFQLSVANDGTATRLFKVELVSTW